MLMLCATSTATGAKANQPTNARKKEEVEAQNARMWQPCLESLPSFVHDRFSSVALFSSFVLTA